MGEDPYCILGQNEYNVYKVNSSDIYWYNIKKFKISATCIKSWNDRINIDIDETMWKAIFTLPHKCVNDFKIKDIQIKIIHRFYPCQSLVSKWDKDTSNICNLCNNGIADIIHTFYECECLQQFWYNIENWLSSLNLNYNVTLNCTNVLMGFIPFSFKSHCINHCLLYSKFFIHTERKNDKIPSFKKFLNSYKHILEVEKETYVMRNEKQLFNNIFGRIHSVCNDL